jgi:hypothetical protein
MCYCDNGDEDILGNVILGQTPLDALARDCCWKRICEVCWPRIQEIGRSIWSHLCWQRGIISFAQPM